MDLSQFDCEKNNLEEFSCDKCPFKTLFLSRLSQHLLKCQIQINTIKTDSVKNQLSTLLYNSQDVKQYRRICKGTHRCKRCPYSTRSAFYIINHARLHCSKRQPFICGAALEKFYCSECRFSTNLLKIFKKHINIHFNRRNESRVELKCFYCSFKAAKTLDLLKHVIKHRSEKAKWCGRDQCDKSTELKNNRELEKFHFCRDCSFRTKWASSLKQHIFNVHTPAHEIHWHPCIHCPKKFKKPWMLQRHTKRHHTPDEQISWYHCAQCDYKTKYHFNLKDHKKYKHTSLDQIIWYKCEQCDYKSKNPFYLKNHIKTKHLPADQIEWHHCDQCDFKSKRSSHLYVHVRIKHTPADQIKWHQCEHCDYKCKVFSNLKKHVKYKHTPNEEIKWYECEQCDYKGKVFGDLKRHIEYVHTPSCEVEWRHCEICGYKTRYNHVFNAHKRKKHSL